MADEKFPKFGTNDDLGRFGHKNGPNMKNFKLFQKISNLHPKTFPTRGHDPILKKVNLAHFWPYRAPFRPKNGPKWPKFGPKHFLSTQ